MSSTDDIPAWRWPATIAAFILALTAAFAVGVGVLDLATDPSEIGSRMLWLGLGVGVPAAFVATFTSPGRSRDHRRLFVIGVGLWPFISFALFLVWRIGLSGEQEAACIDGDDPACVTLAERRAKRGRMDDAERLWTIACDRTHGPACFALAGRLESGRGLDADPPRARALYEIACDDEVHDACRRLGTMCRRGEGGPIDLDAAHLAFETACDAGVAAACDDLSTLDTP